MLEFKIAFPVSGDMSGVHLASGRGYSWHYDFFNAWDPPTLAALVTHCINGGLQCDPRGFDLYKPDRGTRPRPELPAARPAVRRTAPVVAAVVVAMSMGGCATTTPAAPAPPPGPGSAAFNPTDVAWLQLTVPMTENAVTAAHLAADHAASPAVRSAAIGARAVSGRVPHPPAGGPGPRRAPGRERPQWTSDAGHDHRRRPGRPPHQQRHRLRPAARRVAAGPREAIVVLANGEQASGADAETKRLAGEVGADGARQEQVLATTA